MVYGKQIKRTKKVIKKEPGREMAGKFVPNRIFRGKVIEALRDAEKPLALTELGARAIGDWTMGDHKTWLRAILDGLVRDQLIEKGREGFRLKR